MAKSPKDRSPDEIEVAQMLETNRIKLEVTQDAYHRVFEEVGGVVSLGQFKNWLRGNHTIKGHQLLKAMKALNLIARRKELDPVFPNVPALEVVEGEGPTDSPFKAHRVRAA